ncbi:hypothetical protein IZU99_09545 [Oscillospiraceae bacterium CM]|nr:hypothetical protein IZU99_09545 [Oscillospiraceae bacterium CM]
MKKTLARLIAVWSILLIFSGCQSNPTTAPESASPSSPGASSSASASPSTSAGSAKTGLAILTSLTKSKDAASADGLAEVDATVVGVMVDKKGKIVKCAIDAVEAKIGFDKKGQLKTPTTTMFKTNDELGDAYGLKAVSGIGKEWYEQANAFAKYVEGMTIDDVKNIKVDEKNYPTQSDLKATVSISIGNFIKGLEKAVNNAKNGGAAESDRLSLGIITGMSQSKNASDSMEGLVYVTSTVALLTRDTAGKISGCILDETNSSINFTAQGRITTDLAVDPQSKNELKDAVGIKEQSGIGKEWFEQAEAFAKYVRGKMPGEVAGIAVDEKGFAVSSELRTSVAISIADFKAAIAQAASGV